MRNYRIYTIALFSLLLIACEKYAPINAGGGLDDWTEETHGANATPNYNVVFNQDAVQRLDIVIESDYWEVMQADLASILSSSGGGPGQPPTFSDESPIYVPCQVYYNDKQWYDVGIRYKGNSSLNSAYSQGNGKLPFRFEMDHFQNENPNISGQTFYGFRELSFSSNFKDETLLHEKIAADVFREFGIPAPQTAYYRIYVDHGDGPVYFGLYTMVEVVFDSMIETQYTAGGNCYKPDGDGARLNDPTLITSSAFPNKTIEGASLTDIEDLVNALIDDTRTSDPATWRTNLDKVIDTDLFLKWLAANTTMKNWDTYGKMTHNYYLYHNPVSDKLCWVPWDNNEAFADFSGGPGGGGVLNFDFSNLATTPTSSTGDVTWPMISYLYADPVYKAKYDAYIDEFITTAFTVSNLTTKFNYYHNMIQPYVTGTDGEISGYTYVTSTTNFDNGASDLINYVSTRVVEADNYTP